MSVIKRKPNQSVRYAESQWSLAKKLKLAIAFFCVLFAFFLYLNWQTLLEKLDRQPINAVVLMGQPTFTTYEDVKETLNKMGELKGFFSQDMETVREQLQTMGWIKGVIVRKIWPDKLNIMVQEHTPVAIWNKTEFLSDEGVIFQLPMEKLTNKDLPHLSGPNYQSVKVLEAWHQVYANLKEKGLVLKEVSIDERSAWQIVLDNDVVLKLGRGDWKAKLDRFVTIYPQIEVPENQRLSYVDLRYKSGAAVGFVNKIN